MSLNPPKPPKRLFKFGCVAVLVVVCLLAVVLPALWSYWSSIKEERRLTFEEITEILNRKPRTVDEFCDEVERASTSDRADGVRESSWAKKDPREDVKVFIRTEKRYFTNERGAKPIVGSKEGPWFHEAEVVDILTVKPDDPQIGSGAWGSGGNYRGWFLVVGFRGKLLGVIPFGQKD